MGDGRDVSGSEPEWNFFVSYTQADRGWAEWIAWQLEDAGYSVLIQAWDFVPGSYWMAMMERGIRDAQRIVAVLSGAYLRSVYGEREWQAALRADSQGFARRLVPVRVADCVRPGLLGGVVSIDLFGRSEADAAHHLRAQIIGAVHGRVKPKAAPHFPLTSAVMVGAGSDEPTDAAASRVAPGTGHTHGSGDAGDSAHVDVDPADAGRPGPPSPAGLVRPARPPRNEPPAFPLTADRLTTPARMVRLGAAVVLTAAAVGAAAVAAAVGFGDDSKLRASVTLDPSGSVPTSGAAPAPTAPGPSGGTPAAPAPGTGTLEPAPPAPTGTGPGPAPGATTTVPAPTPTTAPPDRPPTATLTVDVTAGPAPLEVRADGGQSAAGSGPIREYTFSFDDVVKKGTKATSTHRFTEPGKHTITLTVTDETGRQRTSRPESVHVGPTAQLPAPTLIMPLDNTPVFSGTSLDLMWNAVPGAADYTVEIERQTGESSWEHTETLRKQGTTAVHTFTSSLERWRVTAHRADGTAGLASEWRRVQLAPG
ncbi:TIR domain-containing protein [Parafrankia sp. FMc2]|uniref:TIR domain-containing protein n=1 Tax=Parafrankia sp. FMc2 TaxID=3233196 RepID=UPI0034D6EEEF